MNSDKLEPVPSPRTRWGSFPKQSEGQPGAASVAAHTDSSQNQLLVFINHHLEINLTALLNMGIPRLLIFVTNEVNF